ncbi:MAG: M24 family metallopeptidase [Pseudomonadota bacterium]
MIAYRKFPALLLGLALAACQPAPEPPVAAASTGSERPAVADYGIPDSKERFEIQKAIVIDKLDKSLLPAMRKHGFDMWIVLDRENNSDPLHTELGGGFSGVRAAFVYFDNVGDTPEKIYYGSHAMPANSVIAQVYDDTLYYGYSEEGLTPHIRKLVEDKDPEKIGINISHTLPDADGLTVGLHNFLIDAIGPEYASRLASAELVTRDFRLARTELESELYTQLLEWSARWMQEALSSENVTPYETTGADIAWWLKDRALELGLTGYGTVRVVREGEHLPIHDPDIALEPGDIVGIDGGLHYLGYAIDIKRAAYILPPGETVMPESIASAWSDTLEMAEVYAERMQPGNIGHEIHASVNAEAQDRGYHVAGPDAGGRAADDNRPEIGVYGHSVGNVPHDIGTRVAADLPFAYGDRVRFPLAEDEWVSIEFHVSTPIPEWGGKTYYARFEETAQITAEGPRYMIPIQEELFLIETPAE